MQQLFSAFGIDWHLLIAQAVNFAIVLVALGYFLYKPVLAMIAKRQEIVAKGVEDAQKAEEALTRSDGEAALRLQKAEEEASGIVSQAHETANTQKAQILKEAESRAETVARDAELRAKETATRAVAESEREVARLAILAAEKVLKKHYD